MPKQLRNRRFLIASLEPLERFGIKLVATYKKVSGEQNQLLKHVDMLTSYFSESRGMKRSFGDYACVLLFYADENVWHLHRFNDAASP